MKKTTILLTLFLITNCSINSQSFIEVDRVGTFNIDNYSDFYIKINEANLSSEISPIAIERFRDNLKSALMETGLTHSSNSNLVFEINITSKDEVESDNFNNYNSRYYWDRYYRDDIRTVSKYILRVNLRDIDSDSTVWTVYGDWRKGSVRSPEKADGSLSIIDEIILSL